MSKKITQDNLRKTKRSLKQLEKQMLFEYQQSARNIRNEMLKMAEKVGEFTQSELVKYNRLETLLKNINKEVVLLGGKITPMIARSMRQTYKDTVKAELEPFVKLSGKIPIETVKASLEFPLSGQKFGETMKGFTRDNVKTIDSVITQGILQGHSIAKIAKNLKESLNTSYKRAKTIARTETMRAFSLGQLKATEKIESAGIEVEKIWLYSFHVKHSRVMHENKDEKPAESKGKNKGHFVFPDGVRMLAPRTSGIASHDVNCRCSYYNNIIE
jgi:hypothetical protein